MFASSSHLIRGSLIIPLLLLFAAGVSFGQVTGTLNGKVTAASGAAVPQAAVTLTNTSNNNTKNAVTGTDGSFSITDLAPGSYRLEVEASGYKRLSQQALQVAAGSPIRVELTMETGNSSETVSVSAQESLIQDDSAQVGKSYAPRAIRELPIQDRNVQQLAELMPGVTPPITATPTAGVSPTAARSNPLGVNQPGGVLQDPQLNRFWSTNGQPFWANRQEIDGVENDEPFFHIAAHVAPVESVQQLNLITGDYDASQGRAAGTIFNVITRSGTNAVHGSIFELNNNAYTSARNYFNPKGLPQARFDSNQFGASVGGPIIRDHTFFFLSYEGDYLRQQTPTVSTVPSAGFLTGDFSAVPGITLYNPNTGSATGIGRTPFANNVIPASLINPIASAILPYFPQANGTGFENNLFSNVPFRNDGNRADARLDHRFHDRAAMFVRWSYSNYRTVDTSALGPVLGYSDLAKLRSDNAVAGLVGTVMGMSADLRFGYTRYDDPIRAQSSPALASLFGFSNPNIGSGAYLPNIQIGTLSLGSPANYPERNLDNSLNLTSNWSARFRGNNIRFGIDLWQIRLDGFNNNLFGTQGGYIFGSGATSLNGGAALGQFGGFANDFASFLLGAPSQTGITTAPYSSNMQYQASGYLADTVHIRRLTLDLGVRYDFFSPLQPRKAANLAVYDPTTNSLMPLNQGGVDARGNVPYNTRNIAPRVGFAYRFTERTVVRGGYGISYFNMPLQFLNSSFISQAAVTQGVAGGYGVAGSFGVLPQLSSFNASGAAPNSLFYTTARDIQNPYVQSFNLQVQQDLTHGIVMDLGYVGNLGRELPYNRQLNASQPGAGVAGLPFYSQYGRTSGIIQADTGLTSNYNALQANFTKRFSQGLAFTVAYTYSKALDYSDGFAPLLNPFNTRSNYGPADFDRTHQLTLTHVWQLPFGAGTHHLSSGVVGRILGPWQLNGIMRYATGTPFTPTADAAACNCPGVTPVAQVNYLGQTNVLTFQPGFFGYFPYIYSYANYGFGQPAAGTNGNAGRNILRTEDFVNYDLSMFRSFVIREQTKLEFRAEAYNLANSPHFGNPISNVNSANFGQYTSTLNGLGLGSRTLQFGLRLVF